MYDDGSDVFPSLPRRADAVIKEENDSWLVRLDKNLCNAQHLKPGDVVTVLYPKGKKK